MGILLFHFALIISLILNQLHTYKKVLLVHYAINFFQLSSFCIIINIDQVFQKLQYAKKILNKILKILNYFNMVYYRSIIIHFKKIQGFQHPLEISYQTVITRFQQNSWRKHVHKIHLNPIPYHLKIKAESRSCHRKNKIEQIFVFEISCHI